MMVHQLVHEARQNRWELAKLMMEVGRWQQEPKVEKCRAMLGISKNQAEAPQVTPHRLTTTLQGSRASPGLGFSSWLCRREHQAARWPRFGRHSVRGWSPSSCTRLDCSVTRRHAGLNIYIFKRSIFVSISLEALEAFRNFSNLELAQEPSRRCWRIYNHPMRWSQSDPETFAQPWESGADILIR